MDGFAPTTSRERIDTIDVIRGLAVGGILIGNMQWFSGYGWVPESLTVHAPFIDKATHFVVHWLIEGKFYSIFSLLFGFGFAIQIARAEERGDANASLFKRRLFWLLVIGLLHAFFIWAGDILAIYAMMGFVLLLFRRARPEALLKWAAAFLLLPIFWYVFVYSLFRAWMPAEVLGEFQEGQIEFWSAAAVQVSQGGYVDIYTDFNLQYIVGRYIGLIFDMRLPKILAMFLLGVYAYRRGLFDVEQHGSFLRRTAVIGISVGLVGNFAFAWASGKEALMPPTAAGIAGVVLYSFSVPSLAIGIASAVALMFDSDNWKPILSPLASVGRMALTNYIMQSVTCVLLFYGFGLGLWERTGAFAATMLALGIFGIQISASSIWMKHFAYGPLEWVWRQLTYGKRFPLSIGV